MPVIVFIYFAILSNNNFMKEFVELNDEEGLDPSSWEVVRTLGHQMVNDMVNYLKDVNERPVWIPIPQDVKDSFKNLYRKALRM
jgi:hypothetical protein